jgi:hypothetical protein
MVVTFNFSNKAGKNKKFKFEAFFGKKKLCKKEMKKNGRSVFQCLSPNGPLVFCTSFTAAHTKTKIAKSIAPFYTQSPNPLGPVTISQSGYDFCEQHSCGFYMSGVSVLSHVLIFRKA